MKDGKIIQLMSIWLGFLKIVWEGIGGHNFDLFIYYLYVLYVYVGMCWYWCVRVLVCAHGCRSQKSTSGAISQVPFTIYLVS